MKKDVKKLSMLKQLDAGKLFSGRYRRFGTTLAAED